MLVAGNALHTDLPVTQTASTAFGWYRIVVGVLVLGYFVFESMGMLP